MSRLVVWAAGVGAVLVSGAGAYRELVPLAGDPRDSLYTLLMSPARRWDSGWFLAIADGGYDIAEPWRTAFFPIYPVLIRLVGAPLDLAGVNHLHALELAGVLVSLVALFGSLYVLHRLTELELGRPSADGAVLALAFFPTAFYLSAIYSESTFLVLTLACVYAARRGWWLSAGLIGALAAATRAQGVLLLVPLAILALYGPRADRPPGAAGGLRPRFRPGVRELGALALVPLGLVAYLAYVRAATRFGLTAPFRAQEHWFRELHGPVVGVWRGAKEAGTSVGDLVSGHPVNEPISAVRSGLLNFAALGLAVVGVAGALRRLPLAYGAYALVALVVAVSYPPEGEALKSLPRFVLPLFPAFMWAGLAMSEWGHRRLVVALSAAALACFSAAFAAGYWIA
jgi:hypothetical protein